MSHLVPPHGGKLVSRRLSGEAAEEARRKASSLPPVRMTSRERDDLIMIGTGAFSPLEGFMGKADWKRVCEEMQLGGRTFWPVPVTLSVTREEAWGFREGQEVALVDGESGACQGILRVEEKYGIDKGFECRHVFGTEDPRHPGVGKVMAQGEVNLGGPILLFSEGDYPERFKGLYATPGETRKLFEEKGWKTIACLQLRNPMHRSHEYLAKVALEVSDGLFIHQVIGRLKDGDVPAEIRAKCVDAVVKGYFPQDRVIQKGYPLEMRYAGPREALLHAVFRQNYGVSHLIVGRDHAGVGRYYGPYDAQQIFDRIPADALAIRPLRMEVSFYCRRCQGMASLRTCPHGPEDRIDLSGTALRESFSAGKRPPVEFMRPEAVDILEDYYKTVSRK
jgi:sulfate adenylyltransferase